MCVHLKVVLNIERERKISDIKKIVAQNSQLVPYRDDIAHFILKYVIK